MHLPTKSKQWRLLVFSISAEMTKRSEIKQEDIILSAIEVFSLKGFEQASMEGIAKHAGVSKRTLYKYFANKDVLFEVIVEKLICRFDDNYHPKFEPYVSVKQQLIEITVLQMSYLTSEEFQRTARLVIGECLRNQQMSQRLCAQFNAIEDSYGLYQWAEQGVAAGKLHIDDVVIAVDQYVGSIKASVFWPMMMAHAKPASEAQFRQAVALAAQSFSASYAVV